MSKTNEELVFQVADIRFSKDGFHIVRTTRGDSVAGKFRALLGHCYKAEGAWDRTSEKALTYGPTFKLESAVAVRAPSPEALGRFLAHALKGKGTGSAAVGEIVIAILVEGVKDEGLDLEELLDNCKRDILVDLVGPRNAPKVDTILTYWPSIKPAADIMSPLLGYGLSEAMAESLIALFGNRVIEQVESHPYDLIQLVTGISFLTADKIAMKVGHISKKDPLRLRAALATGMRDATTNGDVGVRRKTLVDKTLPLVNDSIIENGRRKLAPGVPLTVSRELLEEVLDNMIKGLYRNEDGELCSFSSELLEFPDDKGDLVIWYAPLVAAEKVIARRLASFNAPSRLDLVSRVAEFASKMGAKLAPEQHAAVEMVLANPVSIITGGPGCGKSFVLKVVLAAFDAAGYKGNLVAPTGKAAKRITESTGRLAQTMHSMLGFAGNGFAFNDACPLASQYIVIDEASMVDTELMAALLLAAMNGCRIIIVGDVDQLASVGPGQVLRDIINAGVVPVTRLTRVFRQGAGSGIVTAAKVINSGHVPESTEDEQFVFVETETPAQDLMETMHELVKSGVNPDDIQVLAPTYKGDAGCTTLNRAVQTYLNPEPKGGTLQRLKRDDGDIRVNDRVIQVKNERSLGLVNGDIGWITGMSSTTGDVQLTLPDKPDPINLVKKDASNLRLAYAITVHKSQGAEAPFVLIALDKGASFMLRRNLVYTAVTRGSKKVILFASLNTLSGAVHRGEPPEGSRRTSLVSKLLAQFPAKASATGDRIADAMLTAYDDSDPF